MTAIINQVEVTKHAMFSALAAVKTCLTAEKAPYVGQLEDRLELHLEALRQQHEQMALTARNRFESVQSLEQTNQGLIDQLSAMRQERDDIQGRMQAIDHKFFEQDQALKVAGEELRSRQDQIGHLKRTRDLAERLALYRLKQLNGATQELSALRKTQAGTSAQVSPAIVYGGDLAADTATIIGAVGEVRRVLADWSRGELRAKDAMPMIGAAINGNPTVLQALKSFDD